jgi:hypothetical protein
MPHKGYVFGGLSVVCFTKHIWLVKLQNIVNNTRLVQIEQFTSM